MGGDKSLLKGLNEAREFADRIKERFGDLIKCVVLVGSVARGESRPDSDIDVIVIIDDTLTEGLNSVESVDREFRKIAEKVSEKLSLLPTLTLSELLDYVRIGHPVVHSLLREGIPVYDVGVYAPLKRLLAAGKLPMTRESIEKYMDTAIKYIKRINTVKLLILAEDCFNAMIQSAQATLMYMGVEPPVPRKMYERVKAYLVETGLLDPEYGEWLREIIEIRKRIEHKELKEVTGSMIDEWAGRAMKFVEKMLLIQSMLEKRARLSILNKTYMTIREAVAEFMKKHYGLPANLSVEETEEKIGMSLREALKRELVDKGRLNPYYLNVWDKVSATWEKVFKDKNEVGDEVYLLRENVRGLIKKLAEIHRILHNTARN